MKKTVFLILCCAALSVCCGADLIIADGNKSSYQIVVQNSTGNDALDEFITLGGKLLQHTIFKASGAKLPLVTEAKRLPGKPAIFIGNTAALGKLGISTGNFVRWEHAITVKDKDIYIYGKDISNPLKGMRWPRWFVYYTAGSLKGACVFAEKFTNTRFVGIVHNTYGLHDGVRTLPQKQIKVPAGFSYRNKPRFLYNNANPIGGMLYSVANNHYFNCAEEYAVHYHNRAVPQPKYGKTNPEYFALVGGKRYIHKGDRDGIRPQYCLTNPDVQRLIYEEALSRADKGFRVVEFGQSDGFIGCECEKCKAWYNTSNWGEKLWCFHRDLALKLEKDRPGVIPAISCYGPTHHNLPKSFKKFPTKRMIIDVAPVTPEILKELEKFNIDGIVAWTYYFGSYLQSGFSPARSFRELQHEIQKLAKTKVYSMYNCGYKNTPAINGPWLYAFGKLCGDPKADTAKLLKDYCRFAFGPKAAPDFEHFFKLIDARLDKYRPPSDQDFNNFVKKPQVFALVFWNWRYPPEIFAKIEKAFDKAVKKADPANFMIQELKVEFEYMRLSVHAAHAAAAVQKDASRANMLKLADALEKRNAFIDGLPRSKSRPNYINKYFGGASVTALKSGGGMFGYFGPLFEISPALLRAENKNIETVKVKDFNDPAWEKLPSHSLRALKAHAPAINASFKIAYNDEAILIKCQAPHPEGAAAKVPRDSAKLWRDAVWEIFLATSTLNRRQMVFSSAPGSAFDATFYGKSSWKGWTGKWSHTDTVINGVWNSCVTIPFKSVFGSIPRQGERILMQFGFSPAGATSHYAFNVPISGAFNDIRGFARVRFGKKAGSGSSREIDINGSFKAKDKKGGPAGWIISPRRSGSTMELKNGSVVFSKKAKDYQGLYSTCKVPLDQDEDCIFTAVVKGKGTINLGAGWHRGDGDFAVNAGSPKFTLTGKSQTVSWRFNCGINAIHKGAWAFQPVIFLNGGNTSVTVEKVSIKVIKR
ncbi:MAG: DUF4838 domain-containing protein [Lentisphaeria bacterium]|nr:DUF4838 domain-containing protein [Lentisphaeria bacterium]